MMKFDKRYFSHFNFSAVEIKKHFENALKDINIAEIDKIPDVKFNYAYSAVIKLGIALLSYYQIKVKSVPGHHIKIIERLAEALRDDSINDIGNAMRSKRNIGMYSGGLEVTEKECEEYVDFVQKLITRVKVIITARSGA